MTLKASLYTRPYRPTQGLLASDCIVNYGGTLSSVPIILTYKGTYECSCFLNL